MSLTGRMLDPKGRGGGGKRKIHLEKVRLISLCPDLHGYDRRATNVVGFQGRDWPRLEENSTDVLVPSHFKPCYNL